MANTDKAREISMSLRLSGEDVGPVAFSCTLRTGEYASGETRFVHRYDANDFGALSVVSTEVFSYMETQQNAIYSAPTGNIAMFTASGDEEGTLTFDSFVASPAYSYSTYSVIRSAHLLALYSTLEGLDFSIYRPNDDVSLIEFNWDEVETVPDFIHKYIEKLVTDWSPDKLVQANEFTRKAAAAQHEVNMQYINLFYELLDNSQETMGWEENISDMKDADPDARSMMSRVSLILAQSTGGFLNTINAIAEEFQCIYAPAFMSVGKFINKKYLLEDSGETITLDIVSIEVQAGNRYGLFPLSYAAVSPPMPNVDAALIDEGLQYVVYPENSSGATKIVSVGPGWYPPTMTIQDIPLDGSSEAEPKDGVDASKVEESVQETKDGLEDVDLKKGNILKEWAKTLYLWETLAPSQCIAVCIMDFTEYEIGKRYDVQNIKGQKLFSGALMGIAHNFQGGDNPQMFTQFVFSHITCGDFKVPGAE